MDDSVFDDYGDSDAFSPVAAPVSHALSCFIAQIQFNATHTTQNRRAVDVAIAQLSGMIYRAPADCSLTEDEE